MSIRRILKEGLTRGTSIKVVVIGAKGSGKTSLLTSLYSNLKQGDISLFNLDPWYVTHFEDCSADIPAGIKKFDIEGARCSLKSGSYPESTADWSVLKMRVFLKHRESKKEKIVNLEILDLPGERVADFIMVNKETKKPLSFKEWSISVYDSYERSEELRQYMSRLSTMDVSVKNDSDILSNYKDFLASLYSKKSIFFAPSTVRLDERGNLLFSCGTMSFDDFKGMLQKHARFMEKTGVEFNAFVKALEQELGVLQTRRVELNASVKAHEQLLPLKDSSEAKRKELEAKCKEVFMRFEGTVPGTFKELRDGCLKIKVDFRKMLDYSLVGLNGCEFAPLPEGVFEREEWRPIVDRFSKAYERYYQTIVSPLIDWCKDVDQAYYLVDILGILRKGRAALDYESNFGRRILEVFKWTYSKVAVVGPILDILPTLSRSRVKKVCLVATQSDKAELMKNGTETKNVERIKDLLYQLHGKSVRDIMGVTDDQIKVITCAAMSTAEAPCVTDVPDKWPAPNENWGEYKFKASQNCPVCDLFSPPPVGNFHLDLVAKELFND